MHGEEVDHSQRSDHAVHRLDMYVATTRRKAGMARYQAMLLQDFDAIKGEEPVWRPLREACRALRAAQPLGIQTDLMNADQQRPHEG
eukprot:scaffold757_cov246-Pinguiococcus_pyrenoidosus.AAC.17